MVEDQSGSLLGHRLRSFPLQLVEVVVVVELCIANIFITREANLELSVDHTTVVVSLPLLAVLLKVHQPSRVQHYCYLIVDIKVNLERVKGHRCFCCS